MNIDDLAIDDRIEIYTPSTGTYWGYITAIAGSSVTVDDIRPSGSQPDVVPVDTIQRRVHRGRRPVGHVGVWEGR